MGRRGGTGAGTRRASYRTVAATGSRPAPRSPSRPSATSSTVAPCNVGRWVGSDECRGGRVAQHDDEPDVQNGHRAHRVRRTYFAATVAWVSSLAWPDRKSVV